MKIAQSIEKTENNDKKDEVEILELFDETKVEPLNFTRQTLYEDDCLSYL